MVWQTGFYGACGSFSGKFRNECLSGRWFTSLEEARRTIEARRIQYDDMRPHSALNVKTKNHFEEEFELCTTNEPLSGAVS